MQEFVVPHVSHRLHNTPGRFLQAMGLALSCKHACITSAIAAIIAAIEISNRKKHNLLDCTCSLASQIAMLHALLCISGGLILMQVVVTVCRCGLALLRPSPNCLPATACSVSCLQYLSNILPHF